MNNSLARVSINIKGQVQGVAYRYHAVQKARELGLGGWVMNQSDGSVLVAAEGSKDKLTEFIAWCHKGSRSAFVKGVIVKWSSYIGEFNKFIIKH